MKNKIKKAVLLFISAVMMFSFAGCRKTEEKNKDTVLTSFYPIYLISSRITEGTDIKIKNMDYSYFGATSPGIELAQINHETLEFRLFMS